ncbi:MAG: glycosyltransferase [Novosphingobium sp.]
MTASFATLAVVIPAYNAASTLPACLSALGRSQRRPDEIILFDDGSTDQTAEIARRAGVRVISGERSQQGPAVGRNIAAEQTDAEVIAFVDADVAVHPEALGRLLAAIADNDAAASFGSYDDNPPSRRLPSLYINLRHHWVHQQGGREAFTFWSGLGAIRRTWFDRVGGFSDHGVEDIELGSRIIQAGGRIRLIKDALGTHHKDWSLARAWRTDIFDRALPWACLIRQRQANSGDLNLAAGDRISAVVAHLVWLTSLATVALPALGLAVPLLAGVYLLLNARFFSFLFRAGGVKAGLAGIAMHWCYHIYASITFALVMLVPAGFFRATAEAGQSSQVLGSSN